MARATEKVQTWRPNVPPAAGRAEAKYGGHDDTAGKDKRAEEQPNPSDPGNTGTTPGTNAEVG